MPEPQWRAIGTQDDSDAAYQASVETKDDAAIPEVLDFQGRRYPRDPQIAWDAIKA